MNQMNPMNPSTHPSIFELGPEKQLTSLGVHNQKIAVLSKSDGQSMGRTTVNP